MVNNLVGGIPTPLKNDGVRQLGWCHSQYIWKENMFQNHQPVYIEVTGCLKFHPETSDSHPEKWIQNPEVSPISDEKIGFFHLRHELDGVCSTVHQWWASGINNHGHRMWNLPGFFRGLRAVKPLQTSTPKELGVSWEFHGHSPQWQSSLMDIPMLGLLSWSFCARGCFKEHTF